MTIPYRFSPQPKTRTRIWPIVAVRDSKQPPARNPDEVFALDNCYAQDTAVGPLVVGRPGFWLTGTAGSGAGKQLGTAPNQRVQVFHQLTKRDGTEVSLVLCGGQLYTYNWSTNVWTESVTAANFATASVTLSATARCYAITFADTALLSDGVNKPFTWDGTAGAGGLTPLTNAAVIYGQPFVYYGKWGGIKNAARSTFIWSEEATPNTGFEAGGYNNAWDFVQTAGEGLVAMVGTNDALYVFRQNSCTAVTGAMTSDFKSTGTREALDDSIGTKSPGGVLVSEGRVVFLDQYGFLKGARLGLGLEDLATGAWEALKNIPTLNYAATQLIDDPATGHIRIGLAGAGFDDPSMELWITRDTGRFAGTVSGYTYTRMGVLKDSTGTPTIMHGGGSNAVTATTGYVYAHGHPDGSTWNDGFADATVSIAHTCETPFVANDTQTDKLFVRGEISLLPITNVTGLTITPTTSYGLGTAMTLETISTPGVALGTFLLNTDVLGASSTEETKRTFGMRERGRWARLRFRHDMANERLQLSELAIVSVPVTQRPEVV